MNHFISWFLIPALTFLAAGPGDWFTLNFSTVGSVFPRNIILFLWILLICCYYSTCVNRSFLQVTDYISVKTELFLTNLSVSLLILSAFLPYRPSIQPLVSFLHLAAAFSSTVIFYTAITVVNLKMYALEPKLFSLTAALMMFSIFISISLLILCKFLITSILEIFLTLFSCFWLKLLDQRIDRFIRRKHMIARI